jgi:hypothetical protein
MSLIIWKLRRYDSAHDDVGYSPDWFKKQYVWQNGILAVSGCCFRLCPALKSREVSIVVAVFLNLRFPGKSETERVCVDFPGHFSDHAVTRQLRSMRAINDCSMLATFVRRRYGSAQAAPANADKSIVGTLHFDMHVAFWRHRDRNARVKLPVVWNVLDLPRPTAEPLHPQLTHSHLSWSL